jgi:hypothetical protein
MQCFSLLGTLAGFRLGIVSDIFLGGMSADLGLGKYT